jgi:adenosylhomocysteine nucleosidase
MKTILFIAAEAREFSGLLRRVPSSSRLDWPVAFAAEAGWRGQRWILVANGPGTNLVRQAFDTAVSRERFDEVVSTGYCGALDPSLAVADIFIPASAGELVTTDRVITTAGEKRDLRASTGARAVDMEAATVADCARRAGLPFHCVRVVSDAAGEDLPLDLNRTRGSSGRFSTSKILAAALRKPITRVPALIALARNSAKASETLGAYLAGCEF